MSFLRFTRLPIAAVALTLFSVGCATNPDGSLKKNADGTFQIDEKAKGALMGAAAGCVVASVGGKNCVHGAVIGAVAGFLISWYFESKKVADATVVNKEYARGKTLPPKNDVVPAAFTTRVAEAYPGNDNQKEITVTSSTDLIGYGDKVPEVQQKYAIYDEKNNLVEEKTEKLASVDGAGRYQSTSKFKLPAEAKGKKYTVKTALVSNTKTYKENSYKVSFNGDGSAVLLALAQ